MRSSFAVAALLAAAFLAVTPFLAGRAMSDPAPLTQPGLQFQEVDDGTGRAAVVSEQSPAEGWLPDVPQREEGSPDVESGADPADEATTETGERITPSARGGARAGASARSGAAQSLGDRVAAVARRYLGFPYAWAGDSPSTGFDCSGFDGYVYEEAGIPIPPHDLWGQLNAGPRVALDDLQPGDLVFFENTYMWGLSHGGIYLGEGKFIHATSEGFGVQISSLNEGYWAARFVAGSRPWVRPQR